MHCALIVVETFDENFNEWYHAGDAMLFFPGCFILTPPLNFPWLITGSDAVFFKYASFIFFACFVWEISLGILLC